MGRETLNGKHEKKKRAVQNGLARNLLGTLGRGGNRKRAKKKRSREDEIAEGANRNADSRRVVV